MIRYGLWDTTDRVWLGSEKGPMTYENKKIAMFAAEGISVALGYSPDRVKAVEFADQPLVKRDSVDFVKTGAEVDAHFDRRERGIL